MRLALAPGLAALLVLAAAACIALEFETGLEGGAEYDSNVNFSDRDKIDSTIVTAGLEAAAKSVSERTEIELGGQAQMLRYLDNSEFDNERYQAMLSGSHRATQRLEVSGDARYVYDTTFDSELLETGVVTSRQQRTLISGTAAVEYMLDEVATVGFSWHRYTTRYEEDFSRDARSNTGRVSYRHEMPSRRHTVEFGMEATGLDSGLAEMSDGRLTLGWITRRSETFTTEVTVGGRRTDVERFDGEEASEWGWVTNLEVEKRWELGSASVGYSRYLAHGSTGQPLEVDRLGGRLRYRFSRHTTGSLGLAAYRSEDVVERDEESYYYEVEPGLIIQLGERTALEAGMAYSGRQVEDDDGDFTAERFRGWCALTMEL